MYILLGILFVDVSVALVLTIRAKEEISKR